MIFIYYNFDFLTFLGRHRYGDDDDPLSSFFFHVFFFSFKIVRNHSESSEIIWNCLKSSRFRF